MKRIMLQKIVKIRQLNMTYDKKERIKKRVRESKNLNIKPDEKPTKV